jgi:hypothetical protein
VPAHRAGFSFAQRARGDDEVEVSVVNRFDETRHQIAAIGAVAIHEHQDAATGRGRRHACRAGPAIARSAWDDNLRAGRFGHFGGAVSAAAIDHNDLVDEIAGDFVHDPCTLQRVRRSVWIID